MLNDEDGPADPSGWMPYPNPPIPSGAPVDVPSDSSVEPGGAVANGEPGIPQGGPVLPTGGESPSLVQQLEGLVGGPDVAATEGTGQVILTDSQKVTINRLNNIINDHLTEQDLSGVLRDIEGNPVPKPNGGYWNHLDEVQSALKGLNAVQRSLQGSLRNPNLNVATRAELQNALNRAQGYISKVNGILNGR